MPNLSWKPQGTQLEAVACPLCGGTEFRVLARSDRYDMDLKTAGCRGCGLVLSNPQPTAAALDEFYRQHYRSFYQQTDTPSLEYIREYRKDERAANTTRFLADAGLLKPGMAVLDIGASEGCLLHAIAAQVPDARRWAVEPNGAFGRFAVQHAGCTLFASLDELKAAGAGPFDLITMVHVFEHVKQPVEFLASLAPLLAPGGRVYIDVPDVNAYRRLYDLHIAHLYHFGQQTLRHTAARAGFEALTLEPHRPVNHPASLRCVLAPAAAARAWSAPATNEGWSAVRRAGWRAGHFHRKRWSWGKRLRYLLGRA